MNHPLLHLARTFVWLMSASAAAATTVPADSRAQASLSPASNAAPAIAGTPDELRSMERACDSGNHAACFNRGFVANARNERPEAQLKYFGKACESRQFPGACGIAGDFMRANHDPVRARRFDELGCMLGSAVACYFSATESCGRGEGADAIAWLERATKVGFGNADRLASDPELACARALPAFAGVVAGAKALRDSKVNDLNATYQPKLNLVHPDLSQMGFELVSAEPTIFRHAATGATLTLFRNPVGMEEYRRVFDSEVAAKKKEGTGIEKFSSATSTRNGVPIESSEYRFPKGGLTYHTRYVNFDGGDFVTSAQLLYPAPYAEEYGERFEGVLSALFIVPYSKVRMPLEEMTDTWIAAKAPEEFGFRLAREKRGGKVYTPDGKTADRLSPPYLSEMNLVLGNEANYRDWLKSIGAGDEFVSLTALAPPKNVPTKLDGVRIQRVSYRFMERAPPGADPATGIVDALLVEKKLPGTDARIAHAYFVGRTEKDSERAKIIGALADSLKLSMSSTDARTLAQAVKRARGSSGEGDGLGTRKTGGRMPASVTE